MKLRVTNFNPELNKDDIEEIFEEFGRVSSIKLFKNPQNVKQSALAFVEMPRESDATLAMDELNGKEIEGFVMKVEVSNDFVSHHRVVKPAPPVQDVLDEDEEENTEEDIPDIDEEAEIDEIEDEDVDVEWE